MYKYLVPNSGPSSSAPILSIKKKKKSLGKKKPYLVTRGIIQLLPVNLRIIPAGRRTVDIEMARYIIAIGAVIRDQDFNLLGTSLGCRSTWCASFHFLSVRLSHKPHRPPPDA